MLRQRLYISLGLRSASIGFEKWNKEVKFLTEVGLQAFGCCAYAVAWWSLACVDNEQHSATATRIHLFFMANEYYAKSTQVKTIALIKKIRFSHTVFFSL